MGKQTTWLAKHKAWLRSRKHRCAKKTAVSLKEGADIVCAKLRRMTTHIHDSDCDSDILAFQYNLEIWDEKSLVEDVVNVPDLHIL